MALDKFAKTELRDATRAGGSIDAIRRSLEFIMQALIELQKQSRPGRNGRQRRRR